jgi:hypothetical protein
MLDATVQLNVLQRDGWSVGRSAVTPEPSEAAGAGLQDDETAYATWGQQLRGETLREEEELFTQIGVRTGGWLAPHKHSLYHKMEDRRKKWTTGQVTGYATAFVGQQGRLEGGVFMERDQNGFYYDHMKKKLSTIVNDVVWISNDEPPRTGVSRNVEKKTRLTSKIKTFWTK